MRTQSEEINLSINTVKVSRSDWLVLSSIPSLPLPNDDKMNNDDDRNKPSNAGSLCAGHFAMH